MKFIFPIFFFIIFILYIALSICVFIFEHKIYDTNYATSVFIQKNQIYPKFWLKFLFDTIEKPRLIKAQQTNTNYYIYSLNVLYMTENKIDKENYYLDHVTYLEDLLICEGLTPERIKVYQDFFILNKRQPTYIQKKYRVFDHVHIKEYCYNKKL